MRVFRFMSNNELKKFIEGQELINKTKHKARTNSVGFCFLSTDDFRPENAMHFLLGVADTEVCAVFEVDKRYLTESYGVYANQDVLGKMELKDLIDLARSGKAITFEATEYCTTHYSNKTFKLIKACATPNPFFSDKYHNREEFDWYAYRYPSKNFHNLFKGEKDEQAREKKTREDKHKAICNE